MVRKYFKPIAAVLILLLTAGAFAYYIEGHPATVRQLSHVGLSTMALLMGLYVLTIACLALAQEATLELCRTKLQHGEALLLTSYTAIINFFGPLQSGPGFRAVYLKKKYGTDLKNYAAATVLYIGFYLGFSGLLLLSAVIGWRLVAVIGVVGGLLVLAAVRFNLPGTGRFKQLRFHGAAKLGIATVAQVLVISLIYFTELKTVNPSIHFSQALTYTGAANFSLLVSITPAGIGFRESFLLFSQKLHHVSNTTIVSANLLDRGVYVVFLAALALLVTVLHAKQRLAKHTAE